MKTHFFFLGFLLALMPGSRASTAPSVAASAPPAPLVKTLILDKHLHLTLSGLPPDCPLLRITLRREDPYLPGLGVFTRAVRLAPRGVRLTELVLGPEFWPHRYLPGTFVLQCVGPSSRQRWRNARALDFSQLEIQLDLNQFFEPEPPPP